MKDIKQNQVFNFPATGTEVLFGFGVLQRLPEKVRELGGSRVLIVTDPGLRASGVVDQVTETLIGANVPVVVFDDVPQDSSSKMVECAVEVLKDDACDVVVGVGGGSSMDAAKAVTVTFSTTPPITHTLTIHTVGSGVVEPGGGTYISGTAVILTAFPNLGWLFASWSGDVISTTNPITITMTRNMTVTATFDQTEHAIYLPLVTRNY